MHLLKINFDEVYRRHLCRHSLFGNNLLHLVAVLGIYFALLGLASQALAMSAWSRHLALPGLLLAPYLLALWFNVPSRTWSLTGVVMLGLLALHHLTPPWPWWMNVLFIVLMHHFQQWSHRLYPEARDMSEFAGKYVKGPRLFLLLTMYELPVLLHYFRRWFRTGASPAPGEESGRAASASGG